MNLPVHFTKDELNTTYRFLSSKYHPDKAVGNPEKELFYTEIMKLLVNARDALQKELDKKERSK